MEIAELFVVLALNAKEYAKGLAGALAAGRKWAKNFGSQVTAVLKSAVTASAKVLAGLGVAAIAAGATFIGLASDAEEVQGKFDTVFGSEAVRAQANLDALAAAIGRNKFELRGYAAQLQDTFVPLGFSREAAADLSVQVVELAEDLASFNNLKTKDVVDALTSSVIGNTENLLQFGVVANAATVEAKALELGLIGANGEMSAQARASAVLALAMEGTSDAQGDAARTANSFANQSRALKSTIAETATAIGAQLLPGATVLIGFFRSLAGDVLPPLVAILGDTVIPFFNELATEFVRGFGVAVEYKNVFFGIMEILDNFLPEETIIRIFDFHDGLLLAIESIKQFLEPIIENIANFVTFNDVLLAFGIVLVSVVAPAILSVALSMASITIPIIALIALIAFLRTAWSENWGGIQERTALAFEIITTVFSVAMEGLQLLWSLFGDNIIEITGALWDFVQNMFSIGLDFISAIINSFIAVAVGDWEGYAVTMAEVAQLAIDSIIATFTLFKDLSLAIFGDTFVAIVQFFAAVDWANIGNNIVRGIADGIRSGVFALRDAAVEAAGAVSDAFKNALGINSDSKVMIEYGHNAIGGLVSGLSDTRPLEVASENMAGIVSSGATVNNNGGNTFSTTINTNQSPMRTLRASRHLDKMGAAGLA